MVIIIPCYNEYKRVDKDAFVRFLGKNRDCTIVFSDDGSTDNTLKVLEEIQALHRAKVHIYASGKNRGKAEAIREAIFYSYRKSLKFSKIAYLDADLSVSLEECCSIGNILSKEVLFAFGSRILKIDTDIRRKKFRHLSGRVIATKISSMLGVPVYDTQCGCKVFDKNLAEKVFKEEFISKWLFDVEIFFRIINLYSRKEIRIISREIPLHSWIDADNSKVKLSYFFKMWHDFYLIKKRYNEKSSME
jgi:glycosyltransferase involved in cell wall biosynthesis